MRETDIRATIDVQGREPDVDRYIHSAMSQAVYDKLEDGSFCGKIPPCPGVIAFDTSLYQCQEALREALEGWIVVKLRHGDRLPVLDKVQIS